MGAKELRAAIESHCGAIVAVSTYTVAERFCVSMDEARKILTSYPFVREHPKRLWAYTPEIVVRWSTPEESAARVAMRAKHAKTKPKPEPAPKAPPPPAGPSMFDDFLN